ncbi:natural cytotoxicity triggering receptor 3-like [Huso huso]|uniref:Natural cytotoxicity triggering receptor 3 n=1 Tax=Huso huso TaxID=61971 RepID=A0ABR0YC43_HUSHU
MDSAKHFIILILALETAYISVVFAEELRVYQEPEVNATVGDRTRLGCAFNTSSGQVGIGSFKWYRVRSNGKRSEVSNETHPAGVVTSHEFRTNKDASLYLLHPHTYDSGVYYCEVELLSAGRRTGNGTVLAVYRRSKEEQSDSAEASFSQKTLLLAAGAGGALIVLITIAVRCCKTQRGTGAAPPTSQPASRDCDVYGQLPMKKKKKNLKKKDKSVAQAPADELQYVQLNLKRSRKDRVQNIDHVEFTLPVQQVLDPIP